MRMREQEPLDPKHFMPLLVLDECAGTLNWPVCLVGLYVPILTPFGERRRDEGLSEYQHQGIAFMASKWTLDSGRKETWLEVLERAVEIVDRRFVGPEGVARSIDEIS